MEYSVTTFYKFIPIEKSALEAVKQSLIDTAKDLGVFGLVLIAEEGINATLAAPDEKLAAYKTFLESSFGELQYKDTPSHKIPFKRFKVKIKTEIVALKRPDLVPNGTQKHLSPDEWDKVLTEEDVVVIDVRNWYESALGKFKGAINPKTWNFSQFPEWVKESQIPKDKKVLMYCTGGIRCEKASLAMEEQGYEQVYQLDGGIINYIEKRPNQNFEGECFVFDHRVSITQELSPTSTYYLCPHCGNPGTETFSCSLCTKEGHACTTCLKEAHGQTCSKQCAYVQQQRELKYA